MVDNFAGKFPYGLSDLPAAPLDEFDPLQAQNGYTAIETPRADGRLLPAQFRVLQSRQLTQGVNPGFAPPPPILPTPEAWKRWGPMLQVLPHIALEFARRRANNDHCHDRFDEEFKECLVHRGDSAHPDYFGGCVQRAEERRRQCIANAGRPRPGEPEKWRPGTDENPGDEETWRNFGR
jgi:hypothetical protein